MKANCSVLKPGFGLLLVLAMSSCISENSRIETDAYLHAGVYSGLGASQVCILETIEAMKLDSGFIVQAVSAVDIQNGKLDSLDVLIFPGGSGSLEYLGLGESGSKKVREFAASMGKGIVGICAGGYLLGTTEDYPSLEMLNTSTYREFYDRGRGLIAFDIKGAGKEIFPELEGFDTLYIQYYDGPVFTMEGKDPQPAVIGTILSDISKKQGYPKNFTPGKPAFLTADFEEGKMIVSVGHPEATAGMRWMVPRMARYVLEEPYISYGHTIRPEINTREILFDNDLISFEKQMRWKLYDPHEHIVLHALNELHNMRSRPSIRWSMGLLRSDHAVIRREAAQYLQESEYSAALPDLEAALSYETDSLTKETIKAAIDFLQEMVHVGN